MSGSVYPDLRAQRFGAWYVAEHRFRSMRAYGWTIVMGGIGQPIIFLLAIGVGLAAFLDRAVASGPDGPVDYLWFVAPALMVSAVVGTAMEEFTYAVMEGFKWRRLFWAINATPITPAQIADGVILAVIGRMVGTSLAYGLLVWAFHASEPIVAIVWLPLIATLGALAFGLPLLAYSASLNEDKGQFAIIQRFIFTPMFLFSGTFYPLDTVPLGLQWIGWLSPLWHASELGRQLSYGQVGIWPAWVHIAILIGLALGGWLLSRRIFNVRLR